MLMRPYPRQQSQVCTPRSVSFQLIRAAQRVTRTFKLKNDLRTSFPLLFSPVAVPICSAASRRTATAFSSALRNLAVSGDVGMIKNEMIPTPVVMTPASEEEVSAIEEGG